MRLPAARVGGGEQTSAPSPRASILAALNGDTPTMLEYRKRIHQLDGANRRLDRGNVVACQLLATNMGVCNAMHGVEARARKDRLESIAPGGIGSWAMGVAGVGWQR